MKLILLMSILSIFSFLGCNKPAPEYQSDTVQAADGSQIKLTFFQHSSLGIEWNGLHIYNDPVGEHIAWDRLPKADLILVGHSHYDHLDMAAIDKLKGENCVIICDRESASAFEYDCTTMTPGIESKPFDGIVVRAVPAYNTTEGHTQFHPREREDCGYIITLGGSAIYIAGDTEDNDDVLAVSGVDIAFLPVNQPYTMTVDQAVRAVKAIKPAVFYPYHYGQVEEKTDIDRLVAELKGFCEVRVRALE